MERVSSSSSSASSFKSTIEGPSSSTGTSRSSSWRTALDDELESSTPTSTAAPPGTPAEIITPTPAPPLTENQVPPSLPIPALEIETAVVPAPSTQAAANTWVWFFLARFVLAVISLVLEIYVVSISDDLRIRTKVASCVCSFLVVLLSIGDLFIQYKKKKPTAHPEPYCPCFPIIICWYDEQNRNIFDQFGVFAVLCGIVSTFFSMGQLLEVLDPKIHVFNKNIFSITLAVFTIMALLSSAIRNCFQNHTDT